MRYLPLSDDDRKAMLKDVGVSTVDELFADVPEEVYLTNGIELPDHASEMSVARTMRRMAAKNLDTDSAPSFLGGGNYKHHIPTAVDHLIQRGEFLTSYTPYQPEISQGTLQAMYEFQTQVALLTDMEVANASMYDGATATAEAVLMACRVTRRNKVLISGGVHPHYRAVTETHAQYLDIGVDCLPPKVDHAGDVAAKLDEDTACVVVQNPCFFGTVEDYSELAQACHDKGVLLVMAVNEVISLGLITPPGAMGADIVAAEGQSLGNPLNFGGPHVGLFATKSQYVRNMPGRLVGETTDEDGERGWVLTLSTREQHIRREKATSNICTNSGLCALAFSIHCALLGEEGLTRLAKLNHATALALADRLEGIKGVNLLNKTFFNEFAIELPKAAGDVSEALADRGILCGIPISRLYPDEDQFKNTLLVTATEITTDEDMDALTDALKEVLS